MVYKITISFLLVLCFNYALAQNKDNCHCSIVLKEIILDIENNYPGYQAKLKVYNEREYKKLKTKAIEQASTNADREKCFYIIEGYIRFFNDNHIIFTDRKTQPKQVLNKKNLVNDTSDQLIGIWRRSSDSLRVKIVKESKESTSSTYKGYIVEPTGRIGNIHFELIGNEHEFRVRKYNSWLTTDLLRGRRLRNLLIEPDGIWQKTAYKTDDLHIKTSSYPNNSKFTYKPITDNIYYLGIPAFKVDATEFDSIIVNQVIPQVNANKVKNLIIDLRNNVGGNSSFLSLMRLVYEKPFSLPGDFLYSTADLIKDYQTSTSPYRQSMLPKLVANIGNFVQRDSLKMALKESYQYPATISIIVNENTASSSEYFLKLAKHSMKVRVYGRHTAGTLDYSELFKPEKLPCPDYFFMRPTTKSYWTDTNPIDNTGIKPDVDLSSYPDNAWIDIIVDKYISK
ncbi:MAG: S41 family peptidase [Pedobacter sp.]